jgi:hypothetical protein
VTAKRRSKQAREQRTENREQTGEDGLQSEVSFTFTFAGGSEVLYHADTDATESCLLSLFVRPPCRLFMFVLYLFFNISNTSISPDATPLLPLFYFSMRYARADLSKAVNSSYHLPTQWFLPSVLSRFVPPAVDI